MRDGQDRQEREEAGSGKSSALHLRRHEVKLLVYKQNSSSQDSRGLAQCSAQESGRASSSGQDNQRPPNAWAKESPREEAVCHLECSVSAYPCSFEVPVRNHRENTGKSWWSWYGILLRPQLWVHAHLKFTLTCWLKWKSVLFLIFFFLLWTLYEEGQKYCSNIVSCKNTVQTRKVERKSLSKNQVKSTWEMFFHGPSECTKEGNDITPTQHPQRTGCSRHRSLKTSNPQKSKAQKRELPSPSRKGRKPELWGIPTLLKDRGRDPDVDWNHSQRSCYF